MSVVEWIGSAASMVTLTGALSRVLDARRRNRAPEKRQSYLIRIREKRRSKGDYHRTDIRASIDVRVREPGQGWGGELIGQVPGHAGDERLPVDARDGMRRDRGSSGSSTRRERPSGN